jgi:enolase
MSEIVQVTARQILDSRGNPTVEAEICLADGACGRAAVPSGASTGGHEACELRDGGGEYGGKAVMKAVDNIFQTIGPAILGFPADDQVAIDETLISIDGTSDKSRLGANAVLAVSMAVSRAAAAYHDVPLFRYLGGPFANVLPVPMMNVLNGGKHASNVLDLQEFMILPAGFDTFARALRAGVEVFQALRAQASKRGMSTSVGDEGGISPDLASNEEAIEFILEAVVKAGYTPGTDVFLALDPAASEFYRDGRYFMHGCRADGMTSAETVDYWAGLVDRYPVVSIEDGLAEDDWDGWKLMTQKLGDRIHIIGDDLFVTSVERLARGIIEQSANAILIKLNQIGTVTETMKAIELAQRNRMRAVVSHRSGETEDTYIADLSVAAGTGLIKTGSACRTDRTAKYNQLLRIEEQLGSVSSFAGIGALPQPRRRT